MNNLAEVYLWGTCIGYLQLKNDVSYALFEYDKEFVKQIQGSGIQLSPIKMPISVMVTGTTTQTGSHTGRHQSQ